MMLEEQEKGSAICTIHYVANQLCKLFNTIIDALTNECYKGKEFFSYNGSI